jgi:hypothetical protein
VLLEDGAFPPLEAGPGIPLWDRGSLPRLPQPLLRHLEEEKEVSCSIVAVGDAVVAQDVAVVPQAFDEGG